MNRVSARARIGTGPGADRLGCGKGKKDLATADASDIVKRSCERVRGI